MTQRLLVVDDELFQHEFIKMVLQPLSLHVDCVRSVQQALDYLCDQLPDALIVDLVMPGLSGLDLVRLLRSNPQTSQLRIVMLTGIDSQAEKHAAQSAGVDLFLRKPIEADDLRWHIGQMLLHKQPV